MINKPTYEELERRIGELESTIAELRPAAGDSEAPFRALAASIPDLVIRFDRDLKHLFVNPAAQKDSKIPSECSLGKTVKEVGLPDDFAAVLKQQLLEVLETARRTTVEYAFPGDAGVKYFQAVVTPEFDENGAVASLLCVSRDISDMKHIAEQYLRSVREFRAAFDNAPAGMALVSANGRFVKVNGFLCQMLGYGENELLGRSFEEFTHPDDRGGGQARLQRILSGRESYNRAEKRYVNKNGKAVWVLVSNSLVKDEQGNPLHFVCHLYKITERKAAEEALAEREQRYRLLVENAPLGIIAMDTRGRVIDFNPRTAAVFQWDDEESVRGRTFYSLPGMESSGIAAEIRTCLETGQSAIREHAYVPVSGRKQQLRYHLTPIRTLNGELTGLQALVEDISEEHTLKAQLIHSQKMEAIGTLAGGVAHDFNNLLQAIQGYSQLLLIRRNQGSPEFSELKSIEKAARRASELTQQLLTFSRKVESKTRPVNLNYEVRQVVKLLDRVMPKNIDIAITLADDLHVVNADPAQIEQILMNLGVNARDAMPEGGRLLFETARIFLDKEYCKIHWGAAPGPYVLLTVSDTGRGMDKETVQHIFEPFFTTKEPGKGTGLGLSIVYGIVKSHNGFILTYSEPDRGTTFKLYLPALEREAEECTPGPEEQPPRGTESILLVDDEEALRDLGARILGEFGYTVFTASEGREAVDIYRRQWESIDLVLLDLIMPKMDGRGCLQALQKLNPRARVIVASGHSLNESEEKAFSPVIKAVVRKPYELKQMLETVRAVCDHD